MLASTISAYYDTMVQPNKHPRNNVPAPNKDSAHIDVLSLWDNEDGKLSVLCVRLVDIDDSEGVARLFTRCVFGPEL